MMTTLMLAGWIVTAYYAMQGGHLRALPSALRKPGKLRWKVLIVIALLPIPGPFDEIAGMIAIRKLTKAD